MRAQLVHPGAGALGAASKIVEVDYSQVRTADIPDFKNFLIGVPPGQVVASLELKSEKFAGQREYAVTNGADLEIGPEIFLVEVVFGLSYLFRVVAPVPRAELVVNTVGTHECFALLALLYADPQRRFPDLIEEAIHVVRRLGHVVGEYEVRVAIESEQRSAFRAQGDHAGDDLLVVGFVVAVAQRCVGLKNLPAQLPIRRILQERLEARSLQRKRPVIALVAATLSLFGRASDEALRQVAKVCRIGDQKLVGIDRLE